MRFYLCDPEESPGQTGIRVSPPWGGKGDLPNGIMAFPNLIALLVLGGGVGRMLLLDKSGQAETAVVTGTPPSTRKLIMCPRVRAHPLDEGQLAAHIPLARRSSTTREVSRPGSGRSAGHHSQIVRPLVDIHRGSLESYKPRRD